MADAATSEAARALSRARWGDSRVRTLVAELVSRRDELSDEQRAALRQVADEWQTTR
jgi:hypothetical protein